MHHQIEVPGRLVDAQFLDDPADKLLGVAEQHQRPIKVIKRIINPRKSRAHGFSRLLICSTAGLNSKTGVHSPVGSGRVCVGTDALRPSRGRSPRLAAAGLFEIAS